METKNPTALGHNVIVLLDESEKSYTLDGKTNLIKAETFQVASRYATVISVGAKVVDLKKDDKVYLRAQATIGNDLTLGNKTYSVVDQAEVLVKL